VRAQGAVWVTNALETLLCTLPAEAPPLLAPVLAQHVTVCIRSKDGGPDAEPDHVLCGHLSVLARAAFVHPAVFHAVVAERAAANSATEAQMRMLLLELLLDKFDDVGYAGSGAQSSRHKLWALVLLQFLGQGEAGLVSRVEEVLDITVRALHEAKSGVSVLLAAPGSDSRRPVRQRQPQPPAATQARARALRPARSTAGWV
jgi:hypothetical protein